MFHGSPLLNQEKLYSKLLPLNLLPVSSMYALMTESKLPSPNSDLVKMHIEGCMLHLEGSIGMTESEPYYAYYQQVAYVHLLSLTLDIKTRRSIEKKLLEKQKILNQSEISVVPDIINLPYLNSEIKFVTFI